ncbi:MAG: Hpt domain-containing protein [Gelidibacter sp.]|nr:Hpt domain-containing protein [Gelidibacter sp.]
MVDLSFLEKFTKGDTKKINRYIQLYLDVATETFNRMQDNFNANDWEQLRINAHSLKPQAEYLGFNNLKDVLNAIETAVIHKNYTTLQKLFESSKQLHEVAKKELKNYGN